MTLAITRQFQLDTAISWCAQGLCPLRPSSAHAVDRPVRHKGIGMVYPEGTSRILADFANEDKREVRFA